ncbi:MAG: hypothetical protein V7K77_03675, partial [Nostoc sp.]|uniref:hypothetical protein n=1 Tax=Nostoc sp. TaxID=1180 RepID=UPI002FF7AACF
TSAHILVTSVDAFSVFTYLYIVWFFPAYLLIFASSTSNKIFNNTYAQANTDNNTYDTTKKHGLTQGTGVTPVQCGPEKVSQSGDESAAKVEVQTQK